MMPPPMADDLLIHDMGPKGEGVHHAAREDIHVFRALPGDRVRAALHRDVDHVLRGDVTEIVEASPHRVAAPCPDYDRCGGCSIQHASTDFYGDWKQSLVRASLEKAGLKPKIWREPVFLPPGGRRRVTFTAQKQGDRVILGYSRRGIRQVIDIETCLIAEPAVMALRNTLAPLLLPILQDEKPATVFIQSIGDEFEIVVTGPVGKSGKPDAAVRDAIAQLAEVSRCNRISWRANLGDVPEMLLEAKPLYARFGSLTVTLPPLAFLQPTEAGERALVDAVMEALPPSGTFADLFSGCGTFTGPMLARGPVDAFESSDTAIQALNDSHTAGLKAMCRDLFRNPLKRDEAERYDAIVFDPPRAGALAQVTALASGTVPVLVAVSCNPETFARDARIRVDGGYRLDSVRVVDQFTWSHHVELVAAFSKPARNPA
jgi:23S rRNA (uracil1939-C5)-methyltransferase